MTFAALMLDVRKKKNSMETVKIDFEATRNRIERCVTEGLRRIDSGEHVGGTSLGIDLNSRFGRFMLALNDDDEASFRCDDIASYTRADWLGIDVPELESERIYGEHDFEEEELRFVVIDRNDSQQEFSSYEEAVSEIFKWAVNFVKETFTRRSSEQWHPCYINILESESCESIEIDHYLERLPDAPKWSSEPIGGRRIQQPKGKGIQVYKVAYRPRKYASLDLIDRKLAFSLPGNKLEGLSLPLEAEVYKKDKRVADLIPFFRSEFAIKQNERNTNTLVDYLDSRSDLLPVTDGEFEWLYVNCLTIADVINKETTKFNYNRIGESIEDIEFFEDGLVDPSVS